MKYFIHIFLVLSLNGCYTVVDKSALRLEDTKKSNTNNDTEKSIIDDCIIEGTVNYVGFLGNTQETFYPSGYVLKDYKWFISLPPNISGRIYIKGNIDSSYIDKRVQIKGYYEQRKKNLSSAPDYTSIIYIIPEKIFIVE